MRMNLFVAAAALAVLAGCGEAAKEATAPAPLPPAPGAETATVSTEPAHVNPAAGKTVLEASAETIAPEWTLPGAHPTANVLEGKAWGSFGSKGDAGTGLTKVTFTVPAGTTSLGIPVAAGPGEKGSLSITVLDAKSGTKLGTMSPTEENQVWKVWTVAVPAGVTSIEVDGDDKGAGWGEWVAFGAPFVS